MTWLRRVGGLFRRDERDSEYDEELRFHLAMREQRNVEQVVISENYWQKKFGGDPSIVGKAIRLNGAAFTIIGVTPHNFVGTFVAAPDFWMPLSLEPLVHPGDNWLRDREKGCCDVGARLAAIGIYGTVSYMVTLRTREVGIRMALGAQKRDILGLILRESSQPVLAGLFAGVVLAGGVAYLLRHILYGIHTIDGISFGGVSVLFLGIALLAALVPSRRAVRIEPVAALRYE